MRIIPNYICYYLPADFREVQGLHMPTSGLCSKGTAKNTAVNRFPLNSDRASDPACWDPRSGPRKNENYPYTRFFIDKLIVALHPRYIRGGRHLGRVSNSTRHRSGVQKGNLACQSLRQPVNRASSLQDFLTGLKARVSNKTRKKNSPANPTSLCFVLFRCGHPGSDRGFQGWV
jgi:hypothetical protein